MLSRGSEAINTFSLKFKNQETFAPDVTSALYAIKYGSHCCVPYFQYNIYLQAFEKPFSRNVYAFYSKKLISSISAIVFHALYFPWRDNSPIHWFLRVFHQELLSWFWCPHLWWLCDAKFEFRRCNLTINCSKCTILFNYKLVQYYLPTNCLLSAQYNIIQSLVVRSSRVLHFSTIFFCLGISRIVEGFYPLRYI